MAWPFPASGRWRLRILAYHAIADLGDDPVLAEYAVSPALFAAQIDALLERGTTFVDVDAVLGAVRGEHGLPSRAALLSFDDGYSDLLEAACPILAERGVPAVVFAVAGQVGGSNEWDRANGAGRLGLLDGEGLRAVAAAGVEVGSHTTSHRALTDLDPAGIEDELEGSRARLEALGLPRPRAFSYPYGRWSPALADAVRDAGYEAAFTTGWGVAAEGSDPFALPRVEVHASDSPRKLRLKLALAGWPGPLRDGILAVAGVRLNPSAR